MWVGPWRGFKIEGLKIEFYTIFKQKEQFDVEICVELKLPIYPSSWFGDCHTGLSYSYHNGQTAICGRPWRIMPKASCITICQGFLECNYYASEEAVLCSHYAQLCNVLSFTWAN